ncbi:hypothetical protein B0T21DRAFT_455434 [Apiosordaria backusii]|uniref:Uncharacterized protein n=1 Tax=Apiosordaria backusii TaxID=314023 RepID=A0AA39ZV77_9PEZI|nr:hypothetical protein B0T21DRAFT_455434 [Apiosordaria backusii]
MALTDVPSPKSDSSPSPNGLVSCQELSEDQHMGDSLGDDVPTHVRWMTEQRIQQVLLLLGKFSFEDFTTTPPSPNMLRGGGTSCPQARGTVFGHDGASENQKHSTYDRCYEKNETCDRAITINGSVLSGQQSTGGYRARAIYKNNIARDDGFQINGDVMNN